MSEEIFNQYPVHVDETFLLTLRIDLERQLLKLVQLTKSFNVNVVVYFILDQPLIFIESIDAEFSWVALFEFLKILNNYWL